MKLYINHPGNVFANLAFVTADLAHVEVEEVTIDKETQASPDFKKKSLTGKFPLLETADGLIFESVAIAKHLARLNPDAKLLGVGNHHNSLVD